MPSPAEEKARESARRIIEKVWSGLIPKDYQSSPLEEDIVQTILTATQEAYAKGLEDGHANAIKNLNLLNKKTSGT